MDGFGLSHNFNKIRQIFTDVHKDFWLVLFKFLWNVNIYCIFIQAKYVKSSSAIHILNYIKNHEVEL